MYRPNYPREAVRITIEGLGPADALMAADIGAGTGISARLLGEEGVVAPGARKLHARYADATGFVTWSTRPKCFVRTSPEVTLLLGWLLTIV